MKKILDVEDPVFTLCEKAKQGDADAQFSVGISYLEGLGVKKDVEEGLKWVNKAAEQNFGMAQFALGKFYYLGVDADKDMDKAVSWFEKAAAQENPEAMLYLAQCYSYDLYEENPKENEKKAIKWVRAACETGCPAAYLVFNDLCRLGRAQGSKDEAMQWLEKAKSQHCDDCEILISTMRRFNIQPE
jgi:TPR repeat protein